MDIGNFTSFVHITNPCISDFVVVVGFTISFICVLRIVVYKSIMKEDFVMCSCGELEPLSLPLFSPPFLAPASSSFTQVL